MVNNKPIISIKPIDNGDAFAKAALIRVKDYPNLIKHFYSTGEEPKIGDMVDIDKILGPFTPATRDLRTREHRSPFY